MSAALIIGGLFAAFWIGSAVGAICGFALGIDVQSDDCNDGDDYLLPSERDQ